jgi:hypothetical protein
MSPAESVRTRRSWREHGAAGDPSPGRVDTTVAEPA